MILKLSRIWTFWSKLLICFKRGFFLKIDYHHFCLSNKPHHSTIFQTNPFVPKEILSLHNFGPNLMRVSSPKRNFSEKLTNIDSVRLLYPIMLHHFKKILTEQIMRLRLHDVCPNCP